MSKIIDALGTLLTKFQIGIGGVNLKNNSGNLLVRNSADNADAALTASQLNNSGDVIVINSDASGSAADWSVTFGRPSSGMTGNTAFRLPPNNGTAAFVLQTDGSGNTSWIANAGATNQGVTDTTALVFGSTSPIAMFTLPANASIKAVRVIVDTAFNGTPSISVGIAGTTSKYVASTQVDLLDVAGAKIYEIYPNTIPVNNAENLIITYAANGATVGAARVQVDYVIPS